MSAQTPTVAAVSCNDVYSFTKPVRAEITLVAGLGVEGDVHAGVNVRHRSRIKVDPAQPNLRQVHLIQGELFDDVGRRGYTVAPGNLGENVTTNGIDLLGLPRGTILRFGRAPAAAGPRAAADGPPAGADGPPGGADGPPGGADGPLAGADGPPAAADGPPAGADGSPGGADGGVVSPRSATEAVAGVLTAAETASLNDRTANAVEALVAAARRDSSGADAGDRRTAVVITGLRNPCAQINGFRSGLLKQVLDQDADGNVVRKAGVMGVVLRGGRIRAGDQVTVELPPLPHLPLECI